MIALIGAMSVEIAEVAKFCEIESKDTNKGYPIIQGKMAGKEVIIVQCGVANINAAMTMTQIVERYHPEAVINFGTAGGLKEDENVLDIVISDRIVKHDLDFGSLDDEPVSFDNKKYVCYSDKKLQSLAINAIKKVSSCKVHVGDMVSGDLFVSEKSKVDSIIKRFPTALCSDMEAIGLAQVCSYYQIPFLVCRSLSDITVKEGNEMDFLEYVQKASKSSAQFINELVQEM